MPLYAAVILSLSAASIAGAADEPISPGRQRNLGSAAYLAGDLPLAILHFRLGLMADPHDRDLRASLEYVRAEVQYPPGGRGRPEADFWPAWLPRLGSGALLSGASLGYVGGCVFVTLGCLNRRRRWFGSAALAFGVAVVSIYGWSILDGQRRRDEFLPVVVIRVAEAPCFLGNGPSYPRHPELPVLRRGLEARRLAARGDWWQIQFATGEVGWIDGRQAHAAQLDAMP